MLWHFKGVILDYSYWEAAIRPTKCINVRLHVTQHEVKPAVNRRGTTPQSSDVLPIHESSSLYRPAYMQPCAHLLIPLPLYCCQDWYSLTALHTSSFVPTAYQTHTSSPHVGMHWSFYIQSIDTRIDCVSLFCVAFIFWNVKHNWTCTNELVILK